MRDDFTKVTKEIISKRAGGRCSNPECRVSTFGPKHGDEDFVNIGVAAHITAASPGGPRYDPNITSEERRNQSNGIWLCQNHGKHVDSDEKHFTVELLLKWKKNAEEEAFQSIVGPYPPPEQPLLSADLDSTDVDFIKRLNLPKGENLKSVTSQLVKLAKADLNFFKQTTAWPSHSILLNLRMAIESTTHTFQAPTLAKAIDTFNDFVIVAPPGTGKTTTLLQLTEAILSQGNVVSGFIPLNEWSIQGVSFFQSLLGHNAFTGVPEQYLKMLAYFGRLILILDGWNELDPESRKRAKYEIKALKRDFPGLRIIISTRKQALDVPLSAPVVEIDILSENQQLKLARGVSGQAGEALLDHAWRTPGIRDLMSIPLYLTAILTHSKGSLFPTNKEEVLHLFVKEQENKTDTADLLRQKLSGIHPNILTALAVEITKTAKTAISEPSGRAVVKQIADQLIEQGQIVSVPQPTEVLDILVDHHLLVRSRTQTSELAFQHQQFQEWYASFEVEKLFISSAKGNQQAMERLKAEVLNIPYWEEAILFACERLSRKDNDGVEAVAVAILESIGIDPILASEMICRSSESVWEKIRNKVIGFVEKWHTKGKVDRALHFMINSGRGDFAPKVWPLISNSDSQVHLSALRAGYRFRPSVLGPNVQKDIAGIREELRETIISELVHNGDMEGIELAEKIAKEDNSSKVKVSAIEALLFRGLDRIAAQILREAPDETWRILARRGYWESINDQESKSRLQTERLRYLDSETNPINKIRLLLTLGKNGKERDIGVEIAQIIENNDFQSNDSGTRWTIQEAISQYPSELIVAFVNRLKNGQEIPFEAKDLLKKADLQIEDQSLTDLILNPDTPEIIAKGIATIIGPKTIIRIIDDIISIRSRHTASSPSADEVDQKQYRRLSDLVLKTGLIPFVNAVVKRASSKDPKIISILADHLARHPEKESEKNFLHKNKLYKKMVKAVERWGKVLLKAPNTTRSQLANIADAIEWLGDLKLLPILKRMLIEDLARWKNAWNEILAGRGKGGPIQTESHTSWNLNYRRAFSAIGGSQVIEFIQNFLSDYDFTGFGKDAAWVLKNIYDRENNPPEENFQFWVSAFSDIKRKQEERKNPKDLKPSPFVEMIISTVVELIKIDGDENIYRHALKLASIAFRMPYADREETIKNLLDLPLPFSEKQTFLRVIVQAGEIISADLIISGIKNLLEEAKIKSWLLDENQGKLIGWLELLPFSDNPKSTIDALKLLEPNLRHPSNLRRLLIALGISPSLDAEQVLKMLPEIDERFTSEHEWLTALKSRNSESASHVLLDLLLEGKITNISMDASSRAFSLNFAAAMQKYSGFRSEVYKKYKKLKRSSSSKAILEDAIAQASDSDGIILLIQEHAHPNTIHYAIRNAAIGKRPSSNWVGSEEIFSLPLPELRKKLFEIAFGTSNESEMAKACLIAIDELRDDYGVAETEPRHPDLESGLPWPPEATFKIFE